MHVSRRTHIVLCDVLISVEATYDEEQTKNEKNICLIYAYQ